jgi:hypothetical protein
MQYGKHVTGRIMSARVIILGEADLAAATTVANSLLSDDGSQGSTGIAAWSPAIVTISGSTTIGLNVVCRDDVTLPRLFGLLRKHCDVVAQVAFSQQGYVEGSVEFDGAVVEGSWNPLYLVGHPDTLILGRAFSTATPSWTELPGALMRGWP